MAKTLTLDDVIALIQKSQGKLSLRQYALKIGVSAAYLCNVYLRKRAPGPKVLEPVGLVASRTTSTVYMYKKAA